MLGPAIGLSDEVSVRMRFTPERAHQQAGLLIFQDADNYVKFSRHFAFCLLFSWIRESKIELLSANKK